MSALAGRFYSTIKGASTALAVAPVRAAAASGVVIRRLATHRFLFSELTKRAFAARHAGSFLGWIWSLVVTAAQLALFTVVFSVVIGIKIAETPSVGFGYFLMTGMVPFLVLSEAIAGSADLLPSNSGLVQRLRFPVEILILGDTAGRVAHHGLALIAVAILCAAKGTVDVAQLGWTAAGCLLLVLWSAGLTLLVSLAGAYLRDLREVLGLALQVVFYGAPIVYPLSLLGGHALIAQLVKLNPLTGMSSLIRAGLISTPPPSLRQVAYLLVGGLLLFALASLVLDRVRERVPDLLSR